MKTASEIIIALGDYIAVAEALSIPRGTVAAWKSRNSIPAAQDFSIVQMAKRRRVKGITYEGLYAIRQGAEA